MGYCESIAIAFSMKCYYSQIVTAPCICCRVQTVYLLQIVCLLRVVQTSVHAFCWLSQCIAKRPQFTDHRGPFARVQGVAREGGGVVIKELFDTTVHFSFVQCTLVRPAHA